jgi:hypothetical protein
VKRALLLGFALFACSRVPPPYGLGAFPEQHWRFEASETTEIDGTPVAIARAADVVLRAQPVSEQDTPLELYVDRYRIRIDGAPGGASELAVSEQGITATTAAGPVALGANDRTPSGDTVLELRARPVASAELDPSGAATHPIWTSSHPVWTGVSLLDWWLLALTPEGPRGSLPVVARPLPQIGQYALGLELPMAWQARPDPRTFRGDGRVTRDSLHLANGFDGRADVQAHAETEFLPDGRAAAARLQLALDFAATNGTHVQSSHTIRWTCTDCGAAVNPPRPDSDTGRGRDGTPQQGHVDDLPDHGGVRRGL